MMYLDYVNVKLCRNLYKPISFLYTHLFTTRLVNEKENWAKMICIVAGCAVRSFLPSECLKIAPSPANVGESRVH
jgi:hypothetical protein